jgi:serine/threonine protein kinase
VIDATIEARIESAKHPEDIFGDGADESTVATDYKALVKAVHPDRFNGSPDQARAHELFVKLTGLKTRALEKLVAKTYGDRAAAAPANSPDVDLHVAVRGKHYHVTSRVHQGDICYLYACEHEGRNVLFKVAQSSGDNDLVENEGTVLAKLYPPGQKDEGFFRYLPQPIDSFVLKGKTSRRVTVLPWFKEHVSLADVMRARPAGLDFRDAVWMFKRTLAALGFIHSKGVVHGAVLPAHVLVHPVDHGARLVDWCYAVQGTGRIKAISAGYRAMYPPEVIQKKQPSAATDIYMAARCFVALCTGAHGVSLPSSVPVQIRAFIGSCLLEGQGKRPDDAWKLHEDFDALLLRVVGKRSYRPLDLKAAP